MVDIFNYDILCEKCETKMDNVVVRRNGFNFRAKKCSGCGNVLIHPEDKMEYDEFVKLKNKDFEVKMRMVGNSYAVSIPREIVDFLKEQEKIINNMVKLSFEDTDKLSLMFNSGCNDPNSRVLKSREVRVMKNNRPVFHAKQFSDSANPKRNKTQIIKKEKNKKLE